MKKQILLLLVLCNIITALQAQNFVQKDFQFEIHATSTEKIISKKIDLALNKTTPFIALSAKLIGIADNEDLRLFVWASLDGETKKQWIELEHDHHVENNNQTIHFSPIFLNSNTKNIRYKIFKKQGVLNSSTLAFHAFVPDEIQPQQNILETENNASRACSCAQPSSVGRSSWGSSYGLTANSSCSSPSYTTVTHLIVHHAAGANTSTNWAAVVASYWDYHVNSNGWCDIGYNWLIDPNGVLYVGRGGGNNVVGAHMCGYNQNTMGVCMLGNFNTATPSVAAMDKLTELLAWKCCNSGINPLGSGTINSYPGTMNNISGHKDGCAPSYTDCPGTNLYSQIPTLRNSVNSYINNGCSKTSQPSNPVNDYCSGAIELTSQTSCNYQQFSNAGASGSLPAVSPCNGFTAGVADDDVWFKFTAVSTSHMVNLLNGNSFDGVVDVRSGTCNSSVSIGCDDQPGTTGILSSVSLNNLTIGTTYFVRVYHYGTGSGGSSFQVCVTHSQMVCAAPTGKTETSITGNAAQLSWNSVSGATGYQVWYKKSGTPNYTKVNVSGNSFSLSNLDCNSTYEWSVMTNCGNGNNSGQPNSFNSFITLNDLPTANIQHTANGYEVSFVVNASPNTSSFSWNFGDNSATSSQQNPVHTYPATGVSTNYTATLTITNYCGSQTVNYPFTLVPNCYFNLSSNSIVIDSNFQTINVLLTNAENCPWNASAQCNFVAVSPASGSGSDSISITVAANNDTVARTCNIDIAGETFSITQQGKKAAVNCVFTLSADTAIIDSNAQQVMVQLSNAANCNWSVAGGCGFLNVTPLAGSASQAISINVNANNDTTTRICNLLISDKNFVLIQHGKKPIKQTCQPPLPIPSLVANKCDLASTPAIADVNYAWYKNGSLIAGISGRFFTVEDEKGYYYIVISDSNGCTAQSADVYVDCEQAPTGIIEANISSLIVKPNPASQEISFVWNENENSATLSVYNALGEIVFAEQNFKTTLKISVENWASAIYFFSLKNSNVSLNGKFLVKH